jgi:hypothetical protein
VILGAFLSKELVGVGGLARPGLFQPRFREKLTILPSLILDHPIATLCGFLSSPANGHAVIQFSLTETEVLGVRNWFIARPSIQTGAGSSRITS